MDRARRKINECLSSHERCLSGDKRKRLLPKRVVDVGTDQDSSMILHLSEPDERGDYVALSYCWGGPQQIKTTSDTIDAMASQGVALEELPQTILAAITVTRTLGFRYLWIDSLCILQDRITDKLNEIDHMAEIFMGAIVTVELYHPKGELTP